MFKNEYILSVDIKKQMSAVVPTFVQFDNATLLFKIYDDGKPFNFTGFTKADVSHKRPDGSFVMGEGVIETLSNGDKAIRYTYIGNEMNQVGFVSTSLSLHSSTKKVSILPFKVEIISDMTEEAITVAPETGVLQQLIANVSTTIARIDGAIKNANTAIENANVATNTANNALIAANQAVTNANTAAKNANDKATLAETATTNANTKANLANEKAQIAESAATTASTAAKNASDVTASANQAIKNTNTAIDNLNVAIGSANTIIGDAQNATADARAIADSWKYISAHDMKTQYIKNNIVTYNGSTFIAIRNNMGIVPIGDASDIYWKILALKGDDGHIVLYREILEGVKGQTQFTLSNTYTRLQNRIHLDIGGVLQYSPMHFMETSTNSITLNYPLEKDMKVIVTYFGEAPALTNDLQLQIDELNKIVQVFNLVEIINSGQLAQESAEYANEQAEYAKEQANYAKEIGDQTQAAINNVYTLGEEVDAFKNELLATINSAQDITGKTSEANYNARILLDNLAIVGDFELTTAYKKFNIVLNNGSSWIALHDTQHNPLPILPSLSNSWWHLMSQKGVDGKGAVSSVNGIFPDANGNLTLNAFAGTIVKIDGLVADLNGEVVTHTNKSVLDALSSNAGKLTFNGQSVGSVTSVNGETGAITGLETVANSNTKLGNKVDKVTGKQLSTEDFTTAEKTKLTNIQTNANNYVHPFTHPASIIVQDANNRFVTDSEKAAWNSKPSTNTASTTLNGLMSSSDKTKLNSIETGAQVNSVVSVNGNTGEITGLESTENVDNKLATKVDKVFNKQLSTEDFTTAEKSKLSGIQTNANNYVHPTTHPASIIVQDADNRFVKDSEKALWDAKAGTAIVTTTANGLMSSSDKSKLNGIASNAEVNQNTFSNITIGNTTISANSKTATLQIEAGNNVTLTPSTTDNKIIISSTASANYDLVTNMANGLMASSDKVKLDGIANGANNYTHPSSHPASIITQDASNRFVTDAEKTTWNGKANNSVVTTSANGLMSSTDKTKLNGIETGAQVNSVTSVNGNTGAITGLATANDLNFHTNDNVNHIVYVGVTGSANAYTAEVNNISKYTEGMALAVKINVTNTSSSTININGLGAKTILKGNGTSVTGGNLKANSIYTLRYNGVSFIVQGEGGEYGTADASHVLSGYTIGTEGGIVSGSIPYQGVGGTVTPTTTNQTKQSGYYTSNITITGDSNLIASNIKSGTSIFGVNGTFQGGTYGTATASHVLSGYSIGTSSGLVDGTIVNRGAGGTVTPTTTNQTKSSGYYSSNITITGDADLIATNIKDGVDIFGVTGSFKGTYGTATASQVLSGYNIGTNSGLVSGTITDRSSNSSSPSTGTRRASGSGYVDLSPSVGYYNGTTSSRTRLSDANFIAANIVKDVPIFGLIGTATGKFATVSTQIYIQGSSSGYIRDFFHSFNAGFSPKAFGYMMQGITTYYGSYRSSVFVFFPEGVGTSSYSSNGSVINGQNTVHTHHVTSGGQSSFSSGNYVYLYGGISSSFYIDDQYLNITGFAWG